MYQFNKVYVLFISTALLLFSTSAFSDSTTKHSKPVENNERNSLSAPTSDSPHDIREQKDANDRNLSSPPPHNTTNNKPFDGNDKNKSSGNTKPH